MAALLSVRWQQVPGASHVSGGRWGQELLFLVGRSDTSLPSQGGPRLSKACAGKAELVLAPTQQWAGLDAFGSGAHWRHGQVGLNTSRVPDWQRGLGGASASPGQRPSQQPGPLDSVRAAVPGLLVRFQATLRERLLVCDGHPSQWLCRWGPASFFSKGWEVLPVLVSKDRLTQIDPVGCNQLSWPTAGLGLWEVRGEGQ